MAVVKLFFGKIRLPVLIEIVCLRAAAIFINKIPMVKIWAYSSRTQNIGVLVVLLQKLLFTVPGDLRILLFRSKVNHHMKVTRVVGRINKRKGGFKSMNHYFL